MKQIKTTVALILAAVMLFGFSACDKNRQSGKGNDIDKATKEDVA